MNMKEQVCNSALLLIGTQGLSSFEDGSAGAELAKAFFDLTYQSMLTESRWHFATRQQELVQIAGTTNYQLPQDCLYVVNSTVNPYEIYERTILTDTNQIPTIEYIFEPDLQNVPPYFIQALEFKLAAKFAIPLTEDATKTSTYTALYQQEVKKAKYLDSTSRTVDIIPMGAYIGVRH